MPLPLVPIIAGASALSGLFGGGQYRPPDPSTLRRQFGPGALSGDTTQLFQFLLKSPQFQALLNQNAIQGQQFQGNLAQGLAQRGLSTSGIGTIANAAGQSAVSSGALGLRAGLFNQAGDMAQQNLLARLSAYMSGQNQIAGQPTWLSQLSGAGLGASLPYLMGLGGSRGGTGVSNPFMTAGG